MNGASQTEGGLHQRHALRLRRLGIDTHQETVIYMRSDCHVCRAEGFGAHARVQVSNNRRSIVATLNQVHSNLLNDGEASLSESAWRLLDAREGETITIKHPPPVSSLRKIRGKVFGQKFDEGDFGEIVSDIVLGRYSDIELSSFITVCAARGLDIAEIVGLTKAMVNVGQSLQWDRHPIMDKHCVGGLPGNRTTPIVVAIVTACGLMMPKTSSRAITSPAGTADTMETLAPVNLDIAAIRRVVERVGGCVAWGGAVSLSPADDVLIRVERAIDLDSEGQLVASVMSKKIAAGATHIVLDIPIGSTAKVRDQMAACRLESNFVKTAAAFGVHLRVLFSDGGQPVGRGLGPALEARDILAVLQGHPSAPRDLRARSVALAGVLLELAGEVPLGTGTSRAEAVLASGRAWAQFQRICEAQGGMRVPPSAGFRRDILSSESGKVISIDNRRIAKIAKLSGAPEAKAAGIELHVHLNDSVRAGERLYSIHAESAGELAYALDFAKANPAVIQIGGV